MRARIAWALSLAAPIGMASASAAEPPAPPSTEAPAAATQSNQSPGAPPGPGAPAGAQPATAPSSASTPPAAPSSQGTQQPGQGGQQQLSPEDQKLLQEIEKATGAPAQGSQAAPGAQQPPAAAAPATGGDAGATPSGSFGPGGSGSTISPAATSRTSGMFPNIYNPALSVNGLFLGSVSSVKHPPADATQTALAIQEMELQFIANVDPYFTANLLFSIPNGEGFELEEGFVIPNWKPAGFELRIGRFRSPFGRENAFHTHALPFIDRSLVSVAVFGEEGLRETGLELSYLVPLPWYAIVAVSAYNGDNGVLFASHDPWQKAGLAVLRNVFDVNDDTTLEVGASYTAGHGDVGQLSQAVGGHLVLKWHPARAFREHQAIVTAEYIYATHPNPSAMPVLRSGPGTSMGGGYLWAEWQLALRWFALGRVEYLGWPNEAYGISRRGSALVAFTPTEFSAIRAEVSAVRRPDVAEVVYEGLVQLNITLGAHPAHSY